MGTTGSTLAIKPGENSYRWLILFLTVLSFVLTFLCRFSWPPLIPVIVPVIHMSMSQAGAYMSAFYIGYVITQIPSGILADRFGVRMVLGFTLVVANFGSGMGAQLGAARLLFGMGRSGALPKGFFGAIDPRRRIPRNNVLFVGAVSLVGAFLMDFDLGAQILNFGALIAFMGVNAAALMRYYVREREKRLASLVMPALGFATCLLLWLNLGRTAQIAGSIWMAAGIAYGAWKTRGFRRELVNFSIPAEE